MNNYFIPLAVEHTGDPSWSVGVIVGVPIVVILILLGVGAIVLGLVPTPREPGLAVGGVLWIVTVTAIAISPSGFWPFSAEYHQWQPLAGTVDTIDKRLMGSGDGLQEKFVVRFNGDPQQYGCEDTRCASVREGDRLELTCKRAWQYAGIDGYDCKFIATQRGDES